MHSFSPLPREDPFPHHASQELPNDEGDCSRSPRAKYFWWIFASLCLSEFTRAVDAVILPVILPGIVHDLVASTTEGYMSGSSFLLFQTVSQPIHAGFAGILGNKTCMLAPLFVFAGASVLVGYAQSPHWIIGARALQGIGAGGMDVMCNIIQSDMVTLSERGKFSGILQLFGATGMMAGIILASIIETKLSWRWVFFINPFLVLAPFIILSIFHQSGNRRRGFLKHFKSVDWTGMLLVSLSCVALLYGLLAGGAVFPWSSGHVIVPLVLGGFGAVLFVFHQGFFVQRYTVAQPLIPLRLFSHRTSATGYIVTVLHSTVLAAFLNFFFIYVHVSSLRSVIQTSLTLLPSSCLLFTSAAITGIVTCRIKQYRIFVLIGGVFLAAGFGSLITLREDASRIKQIGLQVTFSLGGGMVFPARLLATQAAQETSDIPKAAATMAFLFNVGQCFGIPLGAVIYQSYWDYLLKQDMHSGLIATQYAITSHNAEATGELIKNWPSALSVAYRHIMAVSISKIWVVTTVLSGVIFLMGVLMKEVPLRGRRGSEVEMVRRAAEHESTERLVIS